MLQNLLHGWVGYSVDACACQADVAALLMVHYQRWSEKEMSRWLRGTSLHLRHECLAPPSPFPKRKLWEHSVGKQVLFTAWMDPDFFFVSEVYFLFSVKYCLVYLEMSHFKSNVILNLFQSKVIFLLCLPFTRQFSGDLSWVCPVLVLPWRCGS